MLLTEKAEEILESLWEASNGGKNPLRLSSLREMPDTTTLKELIDKSILERVGEGEFRLTFAGAHYARDAVRRHRLAERLLVDVLAVRPALIHETACQFEHHLHKGIDENVCTLLGHPKVCPHGRPIPPGRCCEEGKKIVSQMVSHLADIEPGKGGQVAYIHTQDPKRAQMLLSMGIVPGTEIKLLTTFPSYLLQLGESQFAVDREVAGEIYVRMI